MEPVNDAIIVLKSRDIIIPKIILPKSFAMLRKSKDTIDLGTPFIFVAEPNYYTTESLT